MHTQTQPIEDQDDRPRMSGRITGIHPPKFNEHHVPVAGGYIWVLGEDGHSYFGHITQLALGVSIYDLRMDQPCTFVVGRRHQGPTAELIEF